MLGKLTRWLRMVGCEATYLNDAEDHDLLALAKRDSLILLTSDEELYRTAISRDIQSFLVQGKRESDRLAEVASRFKLDLRIDTTKSRCPICGWAIKETPKNEVEGFVPPATFKVYQSFWVCTNPKCAKVYWQGSHWKKIEQTLAAAREILDNEKSSREKDGSLPKPGRRKNTRPFGTPSSH